MKYYILNCVYNYFLYKFVALTTAIYLYGDDTITLYVDGLEVLNSVHPNVNSAQISTASSLLAISVRNDYGGLTGALLSFTYGGCITDTVTWRCTNSSYPNWNKIDYDDTLWPLAMSEVKQNGYVSYAPQMQQFSANCSIISYLSHWLPLGHTFYCRHWLN